MNCLKHFLLAAIAVTTAIVSSSNVEKANAGVVTWALSNHEDHYGYGDYGRGGADEWDWGLRLDDLIDDDYSYMFDFGTEKVTLAYDDVAETIRIKTLAGKTVEGYKMKDGVPPSLVGEFTFDFTYTSGVSEISADVVPSLSVEDAAWSFNSGIIEQVGGDTYNLDDKGDRSDNSFYLKDDGHRLDGDSSTWVGRGWLLHGPEADGAPSTMGTYSDWLFTGEITEDPRKDVVPEPTSLAIFGLGALGLAGHAIRRRKRQQA